MGWLAAVPLPIALAYAGWQGYNFYHWRRAVQQRFPAEPALPTIAIVVPYRDEAHHLPALLRSLRSQRYPSERYEIILVDDHSTDGGLGADAGAQVVVLKLADTVIPPGTVAYKKAAITYGISRTSAEIIVTTDADCHWPADTLDELARSFARGADVVLGPVFCAPVRGFCDAFQALDLAGYQLFTAASVAVGRPTLANGAHFAFRREAFIQLGGYAGVDHLPSGDDVLLLHKFMRAGLQTVALTAPGALVTTAPVTGWRALWRQRLRWAAKAGHYASPALSLAQALAFVTSAAILGGLLLGFFIPGLWGAALVTWLVKGVVDWVLLRSVCGHYGHGHLMRWYPCAQLIYPVYLVAIGTAALLGVKTEWKGRPSGPKSPPVAGR